MRLFISSLQSESNAIDYEYISKSEMADLINGTPDGGTLELGNKIGLWASSRLYINRNITIVGGGFKRADTPTAITTELINIGDDSYTVDDASGFSVGDNIQIVWGQSMNQGAGISGTAQISDITGNVITTGGNSAARETPIGSTMIISHILLDCGLAYDITFDGCLFDGNREGNNYTYDWRYNALLTTLNGKIIKNCEIKETSGEAFFVQEGSQILNNYFHDLNGSVTHASNGSSPTIDTIILGNYGHDICEVDLSVNGHNEGIMTFSANSQRLRYTDNNFRDCPNTYCYGSQGSDDYDMTLINNSWDTMIGKVRVIGSVDPIDTSNDNFVNVPL